MVATMRMLQLQGRLCYLGAGYTPPAPCPSYSRRAARLSGPLRRSSSTGAIRSREEQKSQSSPSKTKPAEQKIRDGVKGAIRGMLHQGEEFKTLHTLAEINGYQPVRIDKGHQRVQLAEGVVADAHKAVNKELAVFARPARRRREPAARKAHPSFLEEDFTLYRIMERRVEGLFDRWENEARGWCEGKMDTAKRVVDRAYTPVSNFIARNKSVGSPDAGDDIEQQVDGKQNEVSSLTTPSSNNEDILVLSKRDGRSLLLEDVPQKYRLLILPKTHSFQPYALRHGRSGTVIYAGLVLFGAVPLTYRSVKYALDYVEYPIIANTMIASMALSISYSLWASRYSARTRQSLVVSSAVSSRIVARDDAITGQLLDEACNSFTESVMNEYFSRLDENIRSIRSRESASNVVKRACGLDPVSAAFDLGLLRGKNASDPDLIAVDFDTATSELRSWFSMQYIKGSATDSE